MPTDGQASPIRTWNLRLNLDELNALVSSLFMDSDRAAALQGLTLGCNGGQCPENAPEPFRRACELGTKWRSEADAFKAKRAKGGKASAASRTLKHGTAQPFRIPMELCSNTVPSMNEHCPNQSTIHNPLTTVPLLRSEHMAQPGDQASCEISLPCQKGKTYLITQNVLDHWKEAFPGVDTADEARRMKFWLEENPTKQKSFSGMGRFFSTWLSNASERAKNKQAGKVGSIKSQDYLDQNPDFFGGNRNVS